MLKQQDSKLTVELFLLLHSTLQQHQSVLGPLQQDSTQFHRAQQQLLTKFHCTNATAAGYYISVPSAVERIESFQRLAQEVPLNRLLTETDSPYMGPDKGVRNEPSTVPRGAAAIAAARGISLHDTAAQIRTNFRDLFGR
jgi:Tat protein secretion system quality control protein TatD with DNase activity